MQLPSASSARLEDTALRRLLELSTKPKQYMSLTKIRGPKTYLLWGIFIGGGGLLISLIVTAGLLNGFMIPLILSPVLWFIPLVMLAVSGLCIAASIVLMILALTSKAKR
jgi:hypothetical protein